MKKLFKIIIVLFVIFFVYNCTLSFGANYSKKIKYKKRTISFKDVIGLIFHDKEYFNGENSNVSVEQKNFNNNLIIGVSSFLILNWIALLFIFEREDTYNYTYENKDDLETLNKYNPMIAGCLVDNRQVLYRDVMAVILNLIEKDYIKMEMIPNIKNGSENYTYLISENKEKKENLDEIESYVLSWLFGFYEEKEVDLIKKLKEISKKDDYLKHMDKLNSLAEKKLNSMGANIPRVPYIFRAFNVFLLIFTIALSVVHVLNNGISLHIYQSTVYIVLLCISGIIFIVPIVALMIHLILFLIVLLKKMIKSTSDRYSGKKIIQMSSLIIVFMLILIGILYFILPNKYICLDFLMIGIAVLIVKTDNLMTKHDKEILNDYYALNEIKFRIEEYSLIKDEQINYIKLWDEYLIYAVAFGIPIPIVKKLTVTHNEDKDLLYLLKSENLYYICKAYLEVMWDMNFKKQKKWFSLEDLFPTYRIDENDYHKF